MTIQDAFEGLCHVFPSLSSYTGRFLEKVLGRERRGRRAAG
jgi:hypothetical protein